LLRRSGSGRGGIRPPTRRDEGKEIVP
jgi:hypothetical protein